MKIVLSYSFDYYFIVFSILPVYVYLLIYPIII